MPDTIQRPSPPRLSGPSSPERSEHLRPMSTLDQIARASAWLRIGVGIAQLAAPRSLFFRAVGSRRLGLVPPLARLGGARQILTGAAMLATDRRRAWPMWLALGGDVVDLALVGTVAATTRSATVAGGLAGATLLGLATVDTMSGVQRHRTRRAPLQEVMRTVTIARSAEDIYAFWRDLTNLPRFLRHIESIEAMDERRSRWHAKGPAGVTVEWEAEIIEDVPGMTIAWRSMPGAGLENEGRVQLTAAPGDRGTEMHVRLRYAAPAGKLGVTVAKLLGADPAKQIADDLRRLKQILETGGVVRSDASIHRKMHPAQPPSVRSPAMRAVVAQPTPSVPIPGDTPNVPVPGEESNR